MKLFFIMYLILNEPVLAAWTIGGMIVASLAYALFALFKWIAEKNQERFMNKLLKAGEQ
jgi:hypothetical protein